MLIAALAMIGLFVSLYLSLYKFGLIGALVCSVGSCETVQTSRWATMLGLPVAAWGVGFYLFTLALSLAGTTARHADSRPVSIGLMVASGWGVLYSGWLTYLELFVIHAICTWCVVSAVIVLLIFALSVLDWRELNENPVGTAAAD